MADGIDGNLQETTYQLKLVDLPNDVLLHIFRFCDSVSLRKLSVTCKRLYDLICEDIVWLRLSSHCILTNQLSEEVVNRSLTKLSAKERCRVERNWKYGCYKETVYPSNNKYMPWLQVEADRLWISRGRSIVAAERCRDKLKLQPPIITEHKDDISRFVKTDGIILTGGKDKLICGWSTDVSGPVFCQHSNHSQDIQGLDCRRNTVVTCSKDGSLKVWRWERGEDCERLTCETTIPVRDRVWSVNIDPSLSCAAAGSAGYFGIQPLHIYDLERGEEKCQTTTVVRKGAAVFDIQWQCPNTLITCGYDTITRLWDIRLGRCVMLWLDVFGAPGYCLATDLRNSILVGTAHHGRVQLWDKRSPISLQAYFGPSTSSSPVYSVGFDSTQLFIAQDSCLNLLDFSPHVPHNSHRADYSTFWPRSVEIHQ